MKKQFVFAGVIALGAALSLTAGAQEAQKSPAKNMYVDLRMGFGQTTKWQQTGAADEKPSTNGDFPFHFGYIFNPGEKAEHAVEIGSTSISSKKDGVPLAGYSNLTVYGLTQETRTSTLKYLWRYSLNDATKVELGAGLAYLSTKVSSGTIFLYGMTTGESSDSKTASSTGVTLSAGVSYNFTPAWGVLAGYEVISAIKAKEADGSVSYTQNPSNFFIGGRFSW